MVTLVEMQKEFFKKIVLALDSPLYITDTEGNFLYVNPAFETITGYKHEELVGTKTSILKSGEMPLSYYENLWETILSGKSWKEEIINKRKDGTEYTVLQYVTPVFAGNGNIDFFAAIQYDITREKELQDERDIFFDVSVDMFCIIEKNGTLKQTNAAWLEILGWGQNVLENRRIADFIHPDDREKFTKNGEQLSLENEKRTFDIRMKTAEGGYRWVAWRLYFHPDKELFYGSGRDIQKRVEMEEKIRKISVTDALTGVYNRLKFNEDIRKVLALAKRYGSFCSLIIFDIDHFKKVNDTFGHNTGDEVIRRIAAVVHSRLRETDELYRWGGEEFVILCANTGGTDAAALAERIRKAVEQHDFGKAGRITISLGTAEFLRESDTEEDFLHRADEALYKAKEQGRNRTVRG